jgi:redox-sensitive bicupin YhaK (pirin superfamily)
LVPPPPPPNSWAARADADVAIWHVRLRPGAQCELPPAATEETIRALYFFVGDELRVDDQLITSNTGAVVNAKHALTLQTGSESAEILVLQGRPIGEPVAQMGPFVMNTQAEVQQAFADYRRTGFGGWPWSTDDPVHGPQRGRFARHADGRLEEIEVPATR